MHVDEHLLIRRLSDQERHVGYNKTNDKGPIRDARTPPNITLTSTFVLVTRCRRGDLEPYPTAARNRPVCRGSVSYATSR